MPSLLAAAPIERFFREQRWDPYHLKRLRYAILVEGRSEADAFATLPEKMQPALLNRVSIQPLAPPAIPASQRDGSENAVFRERFGSFEAVLIRSLGRRRSLCISSQVGCAAGCTFCATARMGLRHQLSATQILAQVLFFRQHLRRTNETLRNVVFMGMGEPFHNETEVHAAIMALLDARQFAFSPQRIMVSTVGVPEPMLRFGKTFPRVSSTQPLFGRRRPTQGTDPLDPTSLPG
jgi:23S rRNA (adenine2503-C2)-methyltransferase